MRRRVECNGPNGRRTTVEVGKGAGPIVAWVHFAVSGGDVEDLRGKFAEVIFYVSMLYTCRFRVGKPPGFLARPSSSCKSSEAA